VRLSEPAGELTKLLYGREVELRRAEVWAWLRAVAPAYAVMGLAALVLTLAMRSGSAPFLGIAAVVFIMCAIHYDAVLRAQRAERWVLASVLRIGAGVIQCVIGVALLRFGHDATDFFGAATIAFGVSSILAELRFSTIAMHVRGPVTLLGALGLVTAGLFPIADASVPTGLAVAGVGALAAMVGGELHTEDWLRMPTHRPPRLLQGVGGALVVAAAIGMVVTGSGPAFVVVGIVILGVLVAAVSSDSDSPAVIMALVVALVWAAAPRSVPMDRDLAPGPGEPFFVALGDSYISGEGAERYYEGTNDKRISGCRRAPSAYPVRLAREGGDAVADRLLFLACSGAKSADLDAQLEELSRQRQGLADEDLDVVLVSIGGNDADFGTVGQTCVAPGDCSEIGRQWRDRLDEVGATISAAYEKIRVAVGAERVVVVPYPMPLTSTGCWYSWLTDDEHVFLTDFVRDLNAVVTSRARAAGFRVMTPMVDAFEGSHRICDRFLPIGLGMNFIDVNPTAGTLRDVVNPLNWTHNSLHPNERGHDAMFRTAAAYLSSGTSASPSTPDVEPTFDDECGVTADLAYCSQTPAAWTLSHVATLLRRLSLPVVLVIVGAWLLIAPQLLRRLASR
jgi:hypothetical protein